MYEIEFEAQVEGLTVIKFNSEKADITKSPVIITCEQEITLNQLLQAQKGFSFWFYKEVFSNLKDFGGYECIKYDTSGIKFKK